MKVRRQTRAVSPYTKHDKKPYKYPEWCTPGAKLPEWLRLQLRSLHSRTERQGGTGPVRPVRTARGTLCGCMGCSA